MSSPAEPPHRTLFSRKRAAFLLIILFVVVLLVLCSRPAQDDGSATSRPTETTSQQANEGKTSLREIIELAEKILGQMNTSITDYRGRIVKRERIDGVLSEEQEMFFKIRPRLPAKQSMAVYLKFERPTAVAGRQVLWAEDQRDGKLLVREVGLAGLVPIPPLDPTGYLAMRGNLYPISDIGLHNLVTQLIVRATAIERDGGAEVVVLDNHTVANRVCQLIQVRPFPNHQQESSTPPFALAEIAIDNELQIPVRYAAYDSADDSSTELFLLEEYTYLDVELNVGLQPDDFNPQNPAYGF